MNRGSKRKIHRLVHEGRDRHGEETGAAEMEGIFNFCPYLISLVASILPINGDSVKKVFSSSDRFLLTIIANKGYQLRIVIYDKHKS